MREDGDYRLCDIELLTDAGAESVHSAVAAAHCKKIAKLMESHDIPVRIDVRGFKPELVAKVIEWMYNGEVEMPMESIVENMSVTHYLGVVVLHHLFENTLRNMANNDETRIDAVNVATHPRTGVSSETVAQVLKELYDKHGYLSSEEITLLEPWAARALVAAPVDTRTKIAAINTVISWIRAAENFRNIEIIVPNISIQDMNLRELAAFQRTLRTVLLNPSTRQLVSVSIDDAGTIRISMNRTNSVRHRGFAVQSSKRGRTSSSTATQNPIDSSRRKPIPLVLRERDCVVSRNSTGDLPTYCGATPASAMPILHEQLKESHTHTKGRSGHKNVNVSPAAERIPAGGEGRNRGYSQPADEAKGTRAEYPFIGIQTAGQKYIASHYAF